MVYLYAIAESSPEAPGVGGLDGAALRLVTADGLSAVVSDRGRDGLAGSEAELWAHETVVERVMAKRTVLPMRFGSTLEDEAAVRALLHERRTALVEALDRVRGAVELGLRAAWSTQALEENANWTSAPELGSSDDDDHRPGTAYLAVRLERDRRAKALADRIDGPLRGLARASERRLKPGQGTLLRSAYLVDRERLDAFRARVEELDDEIGEAEIVCTGPWPPYSFSSPGPDA